VCGEVGTHRLTALLTHIPRSVLGIEMRYLVKQDLHLLGGKQAGEEEIAVAVNCSIWARVSCIASPAVMRTGHGQRQRNSAAPLLDGFN